MPTNLCLPLRLVGALALLVLSGCNIIGAMTYKLAGPPEQAAKFTLAQRPTLVLVENYRNAGSTASDSELIADLVNDKLRTEKVVPLVSTEKLFDLRTSRPGEYTKLRIPDIGKACGAEQVIYVNYQGGGIGAVGTAAYQGKAVCQVRVVDVATGDTIWPTDSGDGTPVGFQTRMISAEHSPEKVRGELFDGLAVNIGRLFHKWKPDDGNDHDDD